MVFRILLLCVGLPFLTGCNMGGVTGSGVKISETRDVPAFAGLELHGSVDVVVSVDEEQSVTIEVDDNLIQFITTEVNDNKLVIGSTQAYNARMGVHVNIQVPELRSVAVSGSGKVTIKGVTGESFDVRISGSGHATAVGEVQRLAVRVSGSGNAELSQLTANNVSIRVSGSGTVRVQASETLDATVSGSGSVRYLGSPEVTENVSGSGSVRAQK